MASEDYFSDTDLRSDLKAKTVRGGAWTAVGQMVTIAVSLGSQPVLGRLLDPEDFGLMAMVAFFTNFGMLLVNAGLALATIQRDRITHAQVSNLFWIATGLGVAIGIVVAFLAPGVAGLYGDDRLIAVTLALAASFPLCGMTIQHQALLRRTMKFRELAAIQILAMTAAQGIAIAWAWRRSGEADDYWALVSIPITTALVQMLACWLACGWRPGWPRRGVGTRELVSFGADVTGFNVVNYFARNLDKPLIGWWWGAPAAGYYDRAYRLFLTPITHATGPYAGVAITALSRVTDQPAKYREAYLRILKPLLLVLCPAVVGSMVYAEEIVIVVLGPKWGESAHILRYLMLVGVVQPFTNAVSWIMFSHGRSRDVLRLGTIGAAIKVSSFFVGLPWGPVGVALSYALGGVVIHTPMAIWYVTRTGPISWRDLVTAFSSALPAAATVAVVALATKLQLAHLPQAASLAVGLGLSVAVWLALVWRSEDGKYTIGEVLRIFRPTPPAT